MSNEEMYLSILLDRLVRPSTALLFSLTIWSMYHMLGIFDSAFANRNSSKGSILLITTLYVAGVFMMLGKLQTPFIIMNIITASYLLLLSILSFLRKKSLMRNINEGDFYVTRTIYHVIVSTVCCFLIAADKL